MPIATPTAAPEISRSMRGCLVRATAATVSRYVKALSVPPAVHLALLAVQVFFASLSIVAKRVMVELPPFGLVAIRATSAALLLWGIALARKKWRVPKQDLLPLAGLAVLGIAANQLLFIAGLARTTATMALVLGTTIPVFTAGLA